MKLTTILLAGAAMLTATGASAQTVTFEGLNDQVLVNDYYNGGTASDGTSGTNLGIHLSNFATYVGANGGTIGYDSSSPAIADVAKGFNTFSFDYGFFQNGNVSVFSGLDGTGTLLASQDYSANYEGGPFTSTSLNFTGSAKSFVLTGGAGQLGVDNLAFGTAAPTTGAVPEPATWAMMMLGFGMIGFGLRRRSKVTSSVRFA